MGYLFVFIGGGLGSIARHSVNILAAQYLGTRYPYGTFCINIVGSLLIGVLAATFAVHASLPSNARLFLITGIVGGFTTFSAFSLEIGLLQERGETMAAITYAVASVACGVAALFIGMALTRHYLTP